MNEQIPSQPNEHKKTEDTADQLIGHGDQETSIAQLLAEERAKIIASNSKWAERVEREKRDAEKRKVGDLLASIQEEYSKKGSVVDTPVAPEEKSEGSVKIIGEHGSGAGLAQAIRKEQEKYQ